MPTHKALLLTLCLIAFVAIEFAAAQFPRVEANTGNITARTLTRSGGENDFVSVLDGELYHLTYDSSGRFNVEWIENSIIEISDVVMHDIDLDGDLDAICYDAVAGQFNVYAKEDGSFVFRPDMNFGSGPHFLHSQDYNGDDTADLMINHRIYVTTGPNEWEDVYRYPLGNTYYYKNVHFMDYDSDGDMDILFHQVHRLWVLRNFGGNVSAASVNINETNDRTSWNRVIKTNDGEKIIYYDRSADKIRELVFADSANYEIRDLVNATLDDFSNDVVVIDINKDGNEELVINSANYRDVVVFSYDTENSTGSISTLELESSNFVHAFGMFEWNDRPAALVAYPDRHLIYTINDDFTFELQSSVITGITASEQSFKDFDGDGFTDIIYSNNIVRYHGLDEFGGVDEIVWPALGGSLIDYDDDGDLDYVLEFEWYENIGDYQFGPRIDIPDTDPTPDPEIFFTLELIRSDIDQDGDLDILTYNYFGEPLELLENDNNETFLDPVTLATVDHISGDAVHVEILDLDGDSDNDILLAAHSGMIIIKNNGGLDFDEPIGMYDGSNTVFDVDIADINSDTYPDIVMGTRNIIAGSPLGESFLFLGNSDVPYQSVLHTGPGYHLVGFANIDNEGWLDIVQLHAAGLYWTSVSPDTTFVSEGIDASFLFNGRFVIDDVDSDNDDDIVLYRNGTNSIYYYLNGETVESDVSCPAGHVYLRTQAQVDRFKERYGACTEIPGSLVVGRPDNEWSDINDISLLQGVERIGGSLVMQLNNTLADFSGLDSLTRIEGSLVVNGHKSTSFAGIENLRYVGGDFSFHNVATVGSNTTDLHEFENLDTIMGSVEIVRSNVSSINPILQPVFHGDVKLDFAYGFADIDSFHIVDSIKGILVFQDTDLQSMEALDIDYLEGLVVEQNEWLWYFGGLNNIEHIAGDILFRNNRNLNLNSGFDRLKTVDGSVTVNGPVCRIFDGLEYVGGYLSLVTREFGDSSFTHLDSIGEGLALLTYEGEDLHQFSNVKQIRGRVNITNNEITSLYGLHNTKMDLESMDIITNQQLTNLEGLNDDITVDGNWRMFRNYALNYCNTLPVCRHITSGRPYEFYDNGIDCSDVSDIRCLDNALSGFVYFDRNENGVRDTLEALLSNIHIVFSNRTDTIITSDNGFFLSHATEGDSISIRVIVPDEWSASTVTEITIDSFIIGDSGNYGNNFGLVPQFERHELQMDYSEGLFLCDRTYEIDIKVLNNGTFGETGTIEIQYPDHVELDTGFTAYLEHDTDNNLLTLEVESLPPFYCTYYTVPFIAPAAEFVNQEFTTRITILRDEAGSDVIDGSYEYTNVLLCSYDPNDKLVRSSDGGSDLELGSTGDLMYTIRFQNTGNYFAENVRVVDTVSSFLDLSTFEFVASSHDVDIRMEGRVIYFNFYDIQLPDSTSDFEGSQGFVSFRIRPLGTDTVGLEMKNKADIYFDYNPPILTNETLSRVVDVTSIDDPANVDHYRIYPNPSNRYLNIEAINESSADGIDYRIYSPTGQIVDAGVTRGGQINISHLAPGMHMLQLHTQNGQIQVAKIIIIK